MDVAGAIHEVAESGEEIAVRLALRLHVWRPRTRLRLIRLQLSLEPGRGQALEAHQRAA